MVTRILNQAERLSCQLLHIPMLGNRRAQMVVVQGGPIAIRSADDDYCPECRARRTVATGDVLIALIEICSIGVSSIFNNAKGWFQANRQKEEVQSHLNVLATSGEAMYEKVYEVIELQQEILESERSRNKTDFCLKLATAVSIAMAGVGLYKENELAVPGAIAAGTCALGFLGRKFVWHVYAEEALKNKAIQLLDEIEEARRFI